MLTGFGRIGKALAAVAFAAALTLPSVASAQDAELLPYTPGADLGSFSGTISAETPISKVRISENAPRETPNSSVIGLRKMLNVLEKAKVPAMLTRMPTPTMYQP